MSLEEEANNFPLSDFLREDGKVSPLNWVKRRLVYKVVARSWSVDGENDGTLLLVKLGTIGPHLDLVVLSVVLDRKFMIKHWSVSEYSRSFRTWTTYYRRHTFLGNGPEEGQ